MNNNPATKKLGLILKQPWADKILSGEKTWEIRGSNTNIRGLIYILHKGLILGEVEIIDSFAISQSEFDKNRSKHKVMSGHSRYENTHAWVLFGAKKYENPVPYKHKPGCVIWVKLQEDHEHP